MNKSALQLYASSCVSLSRPDAIPRHRNRSRYKHRMNVKHNTLGFALYRIARTFARPRTDNRPPFSAPAHHVTSLDRACIRAFLTCSCTCTCTCAYTYACACAYGCGCTVYYYRICAVYNTLDSSISGILVPLRSRLSRLAHSYSTGERRSAESQTVQYRLGL